MKKQSLEYSEKQAQKKADKRARKKKPKMKVSGTKAKELAKIIKNK